MIAFTPKCHNFAIVQWVKYNRVKIEIQHLINLTNQTEEVKLGGEDGLLQSECEVQGQRGAWCRAEE